MREAVHPEAGEPQPRAALQERTRQLVDQSFDLRVVAGGQQQEPQFIPPHPAQERKHDADDLVQTPLPDRAADHPGLTEATPPAAAPKELQNRTVVDDVHRRDDHGIGDEDRGQLIVAT